MRQVVLALGDYMHIQCHACIGGTNVRDDIRKLESGVQVKPPAEPEIAQYSKST